MHEINGQSEPYSVHAPAFVPPPTHPTPIFHVMHIRLRSRGPDRALAF